MPTDINKFSGKIAIATDDGVRVTGHLGRCRSFMIYELDGDKVLGKELRENVLTNHRLQQMYQHHGEGNEHSHTNLITGLKDCNYLISSGGGWRVVEDLKHNNITPVFSSINLIEEAVEKFIKGELKNEEGLTCNHRHP